MTKKRPLGNCPECHLRNVSKKITMPIVAGAKSAEVRQACYHCASGYDMTAGAVVEPL